MIFDACKVESGVSNMPTSMWDGEANTMSLTMLSKTDISTVEHERRSSVKNYLGHLLPLPPAALHILLALAAEELHGYAIMKEVARHSEGQYKLGPGTLYHNLEKLMDRGLVKETLRQSKKEETARRFYQLTSFGRRVLSADLARLRNVLKVAKLRLNPADLGKTL
jgi:DNA-binding PadR family transcriptional regulator